jgi:hypothetical protein
VIASACSDNSSLTAPDAAVSPAVESARQMARGIALAMASPSVRATVRDAMRASLYDGHNLVLQDFAETPAGQSLMAAAAAARSISTAALMAELAALPRTDFYVPVRAHRQSWTGGPELVVVAAFDAPASVPGYSPDGRVTPISPRAAAGATPFFILQPAEFKGLRVNPQPATAGAVIEDVGDGQGSEIFRWHGADGGVTTIDMADPNAAAQMATLRAKLAKVSTTLGPSMSSGAAPPCDPRQEFCGCDVEPDDPQCIQSPEPPTRIHTFKHYTCDNGYCWTDSEFRIEGRYYGPGGTQAGYGEYYRGSVAPDTTYTWDAAVLFHRILEGSTEFIDMHIVEQDRNEPFGVNKDDDCGIERITSVSNGYVVGYANTDSCWGDYTPRSIDASFSWARRYY